MSYRVAFVSFPSSEHFYPVNCFRGDIQPGDIVYVTMNKKKVYKKAKVKAIEFLNWKCTNTIYCLASELKQKDGSSHIVERQKSDVRFHVREDLISFLMSTGWKQVAKNTRRSPLYYWKDNASRTARLRFHNKGIDVQVFNTFTQMEAGHDGREMPNVNDQSKITRHRYYHSKRCIFEFIAEFADAFSNNESDLGLYLKQIGEDGPKKSEVSDFQVGKSADKGNKSNDGLTSSELYNIMSDGEDGPAYLGDGIYIGSDGSMFE